MRFRRSWYKTEVLTDNSTAGDGNVEMAKSNGQSNTEDGLIQNGKRQFIDYSTAPSGTTPGVVRGAINNDPQKVTSLLAAAPFTAVT
ncbi:hypothetical protein IAI19_11635, partial [Streptococcus pseudopneumoniae]|uniref:hypothetical protein n=1 Tax=Streptococcus pseudopneumoniae TaxID=257758 RepID=UPI0018B01B6A